MSHIDLHLHTTYSDGVLTPEALVAEAAARGVTLLAITDHDEVGGVLPAQAAGAALGVRVLSGVEINTEDGREEIHILGYGFPADSAVLHAGLDTLRRERVTRLVKMLERLQAMGYPLQERRVLELAGHGSVGRPHLARALVEAGFVASIGEAFERLLGHRSPAYVPRRSFPPAEAIGLIHQAGGLASLAHPGKLGDPSRIINRLRADGLDAVEVYHSDHTPRDIESMLRWARQYRLLITGGSDSHGPHGPHATQVGDVAVPDAVGEVLLQALAR